MGKRPETKEESQQVSNAETEVLLGLLEETLKNGTPGDIVELGCYRGDTSFLFERQLEKFRHENPEKPLKFLWIYDSFEGLPEKTKEDISPAGEQFKKGELLVSKREVVEKFKKAGLKVPRIRKNFFENLDPNTDLPEKISFAFLDGDLYESIKTSLKLIENKIEKQGIIIVHDYNNPELPGSSRAVDEWLRTHPSKSLEIKETLAIIK